MSRVYIRQDMDPYLMTAISGRNGKMLLVNEYINGKISEQRFGDREVFRYDYALDHNNHVVLTKVTVPDDSVRTFRFK
jgi:hypothetical protein